MATFATWRDVAARSFGLDVGPKFLDKVAQLCTDADAAGHRIDIWHAGSIASGKLDACPCISCAANRAAADATPAPTSGGEG